MCDEPRALCFCPNAGVDGDGVDGPQCGGGDCDDNDADRFPGNAEICDAENIDEDCDPTTFGVRDTDGDGFIDDACCNGDACGNDCNDLDPGTNPVVPEVCNGFDDDCDGDIDDAPAVVMYRDDDRDGFGANGAVSQRMCPGTSNFSPYSNDCDDGNPAIVPGAMRCSAQNPREVLICQSDGTYVIASCPEKTDSICVPQPNGTGDCEPRTKPKDH